MSTIRKVCNVCRAELRVLLEAQSVLCPVCRNINSYSCQGNQYTNYSNGPSGNMNVNNRYHQGPFSSPPQRQPPVHVWPRVPQQFSPRVSTGYGWYYPPPPPPQYSSRPPPGNGYYQQPFQASSPPPFHSGYYEQDLHPSDYNDNNYQAPSNLSSSLPRPSPQVSPPQVQNNGYYQQPFQTSPQVSTLQVQPLRPSPQIPLHSVVQVQQVSTPPARANSYIQQPSQQSPKVSNPPKYGRKRAVICGVSYRGQKCSLDGSINDAISMKEFLVRHRSFQDSSIILLTEDDTDPSRIPTKRNMQMALHWLVEGCQPGDSLVFYYSGHGSRERDFDGDEIDGFDEMLCPVDYKTAGKISDDDINATIVRPLPQGAKLHAIIDTCFSGSIIDLSFICRMDRKGETTWEDQRMQYAEYKGTSGGLAISISACDDHQTCGDTTAFTGTSAGALTHSFIETMTREPKLTYGSLLKSMCNKVTEAQERLGQPPQDPQLASSEKFDVHSKPIVL